MRAGTASAFFKAYFTPSLAQALVLPWNLSVSICLNNEQIAYQVLPCFMMVKSN